MGVMTAAMVGLGVMQAGMQVAAGKSQSNAIKEQGEYNAKVYEQQANMIEVEKGLEAYQYNRKAVRTRATSIARVGKSGLMLSGSPLASIIDTETQIRLDEAVGQYNLEVEKRYALSGAAESRRRAAVDSRLAKYQSYGNAFSTIMNTGMYYALFGGKGVYNGKTSHV